jgi:outer membrane protein assembly factor BamB
MWRQMARGVGCVALIFTLVVGVLLTLDGVRGSQQASIYAPDVTRVQAQARSAAAEQELVLTARALDQAARHAYFSHVAFRRTGIMLLVAGLLVTLGCWHLAGRWGRTLVNPRDFPVVDVLQRRREARRILLLAGVGGVVVLLAWALTRHAYAPAGAVAPGVTASRAAEAGVASGGAGALTSQWCVFRGPRLGVAWMTNLPVAWDGGRHQGVLWRRLLDRPGMSSPVLWEGTIFLTAADETQREVIALEAATGQVRWRRTVADGGDGAELPRTSADTGLAAPTPACDAAAVYAVFGSGDLVALRHDGSLRWQQFLRRPVNDYGHASSLWIEPGRVCVQYDQKEEGRVLVVAAEDGRIVWEKERTRGPSWSSPVALTEGNRRLLLLNGHGQLEAYDLQSGAARWSVEGVTGEVAPSPAAWQGRVLVANAYARLVCYNLSAMGTPVWEYADALPDVASPVADQGLVFLASSDGRLVCLDATDGRALWTHEYAHGFYASPIVAGGRLYALDREGNMRIVAVERAFRELATCALGEAADATPAFAEGRIYIRTRTALWCLGAR